MKFSKVLLAVLLPVSLFAQKNESVEQKHLSNKVSLDVGGLFHQSLSLAYERKVAGKFAIKLGGRKNYKPLYSLEMAQGGYQLEYPSGIRRHDYSLSKALDNFYGIDAFYYFFENDKFSAFGGVGVRRGEYNYHITADRTLYDSTAVYKYTIDETVKSHFNAWVISAGFQAQITPRVTMNLVLGSGYGRIKKIDYKNGNYAPSNGISFFDAQLNLGYSF